MRFEVGDPVDYVAEGGTVTTVDGGQTSVLYDDTRSEEHTSELQSR